MNKFLPGVHPTIVGTLTLLSAAILLFAMATAAFAQQDYKTPQDAVDALVATGRSGDQKAALIVLGRGGEDIISSGDNVSDDAVRQRFVASYDAKHAITMEGDSKAVLVIGDNDYPFPIPIARNKNGTWSFDTQAGRREILYRRIGHNELDAIQTCLAYVDAQKEYASKDRTGAGANVYAGASSARPARRTVSMAGGAGRGAEPARRAVRGGIGARLWRRRRPLDISWRRRQNLNKQGPAATGVASTTS